MNCLKSARVYTLHRCEFSEVSMVGLCTEPAIDRWYPFSTLITFLYYKKYKISFKSCSILTLF